MSNKVQEKLMSSIRKTKNDSTAKKPKAVVEKKVATKKAETNKKPAAKAPAVAKKAPAVAKKSKPTPAKKKVVTAKKVANDNNQAKETKAVERIFQSSSRVWPD